MRFVLDSIRRLLTAALVIVLFACAVEVALRIGEFRRSSSADAATTTNIPHLPSRATGYELPLAWKGEGRHAETGAPLRLIVSSLGTRGPEPAWSKPPGTLRILCLGDETTLAEGLPEESAYPGRLATLLQGRLPQHVEVINAGLPGGCPLTELIQYRRLLERLAPDLVILHVDLSDADDDHTARQTLFVDEAGLPVAVVHPSLVVTPSALGELSSRFALAAWLERRLGASLAGRAQESPQARFQRQLAAWSPSADTPAGQRILAPVSQLKQWLEGRGGQLVLATFPNAWQAAELLRPGQAYEGGNALLNRPATAVAEAGRVWQVPVVDATAAVLAHDHPARLYLSGGGALSSEGHALYAAELMRALFGSLPAAGTASRGIPSVR